MLQLVVIHLDGNPLLLLPVAVFLLSLFHFISGANKFFKIYFSERKPNLDHYRG